MALACSGEDVITVGLMLAPYLGPRRRERLAELLSRRTAAIAAITAERTCLRCGKLFKPTFKRGMGPNHQRYCSRQCAQARRDHRRRFRRAAGQGSLLSEQADE